MSTLAAELVEAAHFRGRKRAVVDADVVKNTFKEKIRSAVCNTKRMRSIPHTESLVSFIFSE